jgi:cell division protein FtsQ
MPECSSKAAPAYSRRQGGREAARGDFLLGRLLWLVIGLLALFLVGELAFHLLVSPRLRVRSIDVRSDLPLSREEILRLAGLEGNEGLFSLDLQEIRGRLEAHPAVRQVTVERVFPDTLRLALAAREPLAACLVEGEEDTALLAVDEEGAVFPMAAWPPARDLPVISGLAVRRPGEGGKLPRMLAPFLHQMRELQERQPDLYRLISEIRILPTSEVSYELLVYPLFGATRIRTGAAFSAEALKSAFLVLDLMRREGIDGNVREIDFRTQEVVYRIKEE